MIIKYSRQQSAKKYIFTSDTSGYVTISGKIRLHLPEYMHSNISVNQDENETSGGV